MFLGSHSRSLFLKLFSLLLVLNVVLLVGYVSKHQQLSFFNFSNNSPQKEVLSVSSKVNPQKPYVKKIAPTPTPTSVPQSSGHGIYLGMWTQGFWDESTYTLHPEKLQQLESMIGKKVAIAHYYHGWQNLENPSLMTELNTISNNGWRPMLSVSPYFFSDCQDNGKSLYGAIASGSCDSFLKTAAQNLKSYGKPFFLRFAWEMNLPTTQWSPAKTGSTNEEFVHAWQHMHDIFTSSGATNVLWVFCPNVITSQSTSYNSLYPGDVYVDWVCLDGYNWGTTQPWSSWQTFQNIFATSYNNLLSLAPTKPMMIGETNTTNIGGDKPSWYKDVLVTQLPFNFPKISAVVFYNEDRTTQENVNWLINVTSDSLSAFASAVQQPFYLSSF